MEKLHEIYTNTIKLNKNRPPSDSSRVASLLLILPQQLAQVTSSLSVIN